MAETPPANILFHRHADGRKLAWRKTGEGPPVVMLHGWSMSGSVFHEVASALSADFQVLCPDLSGHGWSDSPESYSLEGMAADIADWLDALGISSTALLGWSLGGQVAMQLAGRKENDDSPVNRLLLISTTPCFCQKQGWTHGLPQTQIKTMNRQLKRAYLKTLGEFFDLQFADETLTVERRREILGFAARASRLPSPENCRAALNILGTEDIRTQIKNLNTQVLVMHGSNDRIIPAGAGQFLAEEITGAEFHLLEDVGHAPFMSRPEESVAIWRKFLK